MVRVPYFYGNLLAHATFSTVPINIPLLYFNHFSPFCFTSLLACKTIYSILTMTSFLYNSAIFHLPTCDSHSYDPHQKPFLLPQLFSRFKLLWRTNERDFLFSPCFPGPVSQYVIVQSQKICVSYIVSWWRWLQSEWEICSLPYPQSIIITSIPYEYISQDLRYPLRLLFQQIQFSYQAWHSNTLFIVHFLCIEILSSRHRTQSL